MSLHESNILSVRPQTIDQAKTRTNIGFSTRISRVYNMLWPGKYYEVEIENPTKHIFYYPYIDNDKFVFVDGHEYHFTVGTTGIQLHDSSLSSYNAIVFTNALAYADPGETIVKLTPWFTVKAGNSVQADIDWVGENLIDPGFGVYEQTAAVHIQFSEYLAANQTIRMYLIGTESWINEYTTR